MQYVLGFVAAVVAFVVYLYLCFMALIWVGIPLAIWTGTAGVGGGVVFAAVRMVIMLTGRDTSVPVLTPADFADARARLPRYKHVAPDVAWPQYFVRQVTLDRRALRKRLVADLGRMWKWLARPFLSGDYAFALIFWPLLVPVVAVPVAVSLGAAVAYAIAWVTILAVSAVAWAAGAATTVGLNAFGAALRKVRRAAATCPQCHEISVVPAYRCRGPHPRGDNLHRDLRPGKLGVLWRDCACGQRLPTTVLRAAFQLQADCQHCGHPLHPGAGVVTDVRVPVFGAASAGKTRLLAASLVALNEGATGGGYTMRMADEPSGEVYHQYQKVIVDGLPTTKTPTSKPFAVTAELVKGRQTAHLHVFDAAGESLVDSGTTADYFYLGLARTLVFVLDPLSIPDVRDQLDTSFQQLKAGANAASHDPEDSYHSAVMSIRRSGVATRTPQRLAFVLSKQDVLAQMPIGAGVSAPTVTSAAVCGWLRERRLDNLILSAERDFAEVRYFAVSSRDLRGGAAAPLRWLLAADRFPLS